ncbi:MAG: hypothetical protein K6F35_08735 [Lachnospiraceae bacterium]|nr:hypothetical protein [Lachnospiraceae bacterium]
MGSDGILMKKYRQYLLPSILTSLAFALNEFVDCMVISNLLGKDALAVANLSCPVMLFFAACYVLLGSGGSTRYALLLGRWDQAGAGKVFRISMILGVMSGIMLLLAGLLFRKPMTMLLCAEESLRPMFSDYFTALLFTAPVLTTMLTFVCFLPPSGAPVVATVVNITANGLNLIMDYVYIRIFGMGMRGAALATVTGYLAGALIVAVLWKQKKLKITDSPVSLRDMKMTGMILALGAPPAMLQICYAVKYAYSNHLSMVYGGRTGVVAFTLCLQTFSLASVFLLGVADTAQPLLAMLSGQKDYKGEKAVLKRSYLLQILFSLVLVFFFEVFPTGIALLYSVRDEETLAIAVRGIRIFAMTYLFRSVCIQCMRFLQVEQKNGYAMAISLFDGLSILPIGFILCRNVGLDGLFMAYPLSALILLLSITAASFVAWKKNPGMYSSLFLVRTDMGIQGVLQLTITDRPEDISEASEQMIDFCRENGVSGKQAFRVGLACEEMAVYTQNHRKDTGDIDLLLRIREHEMTLNFRSIGEPFDLMHRTDEDMPENILLLQKAATSISYDYIMGMNSTQLVVERN